MARKNRLAGVLAVVLTAGLLFQGCGNTANTGNTGTNGSASSEDAADESGDETGDASAEDGDASAEDGDASAESDDASAEDGDASDENENENAGQEETELTIPEVKITASEIPDTEAFTFVKNMKVGWNLGNTFDANNETVYDGSGDTREMNIESMWCGIKTSEAMIDALREAGFNTIRIPVSWHNHVYGEDFTISENWLNRVQEIVDYAMDNEMYVILNIHHDIDAAYCYPDSEHLDSSLHYMTSIWNQLAARFGSYDDHMIFESINEPRLKDTENEWWLDMTKDNCKDSLNCINQWNQNFVDVVRATGGNNATRYLMVPSYDASGDYALLDEFVLPTDIEGNSQRIIVSVHAYIPYNYALQDPAEAQSTDAFIANDSTSTQAIDTLMQGLYDKYVSKEIPVVVGEFGARAKGDNVQSRVDYATYYIAAARAKGISCCWWDNNAFSGTGELFGLLNRSSVTWAYPEIVEGLMKYSE